MRRSLIAKTKKELKLLFGSSNITFGGMVAGVNRFFFQPRDKRGLMLAHGVGLGKTIISGMILKHLLYHKHIKNVLVVIPLSIIRQWMGDLRSKFSIEPVEITALKLKRFIPILFVPEEIISKATNVLSEVATSSEIEKLMADLN